MKYIVEHHTGTEESFIENGADHVSLYDNARAAIDAIGNIFWHSAHNREHQSPIVRLKCED